VRAGLVSVAVAGVLPLAGVVGPVPGAAARPAVRPAATCATVFTHAFRAAVATAYPHQRVTAAITDVRTGCHYSLHPGMRITTASVIKAQVLGAVLLRAQDHGRGLDAYEKHNVHPMIRYSANDPYVSRLYSLVGGVAGMDRFDRRMHATHTTNTAAYGATVTTAADRTAIALRMLYGGGPLHAAARAVAWRYMRHVQPTQQWGITAGVPAGWSVALKNGFYPMSGHGWRVGSTGFVRAPGSTQGYAITVMTDQDTSQVQGIHLVERVSRLVAKALTGDAAGARPVDRARCVTTHAGQSWPSVAHRVGATDWRAVRLVSGGNPSPLQGQRACSPHLRAG
jgi:beta-lactamase class A